MTPALGRIKRGVRCAVGLCGGVDGAAATAGRSRSVAGDWNNLNDRVFPPLDCALALDEIALAQGRLPPIVAALARELGGVFVPFIDCAAEEGSPAFLAMALSQRLGELAGEIAAALADGRIDAGEAARIMERKHELDRVSAQLGQVIQAMHERD